MKSVFFLLVFLFVTGCSQTPQYAVPSGVPQAQVKSELDALYNRRNGLDLTEAATTACKYGRTVVVKPGNRLFSVSPDVSKPDGFIAIEAGRPLHLVLHGWASGNRSCTVNFVSEFRPGARYVIKGGLVDDASTLSGCYIEIFDLDSGSRVEKIKAPSLARNCVLDDLPLLE